MHISKAHKIFIALALFVAACAPMAQAQRVAIKTNALDYISLQPNLTLECRVSQLVSLQLGLAARPYNTHKWTVFNFRTENYQVEPEIRFWINRPMARNFVAISATACAFNTAYGDRHWIGDCVALGASYGYAIVLHRHWNLELEAGIGAARFSAYNYRGDKMPEEGKNWHKWRPVPIRCGVNFAYIF